jgi:hypothetical protein
MIMTEFYMRQCCILSILQDAWIVTGYCNFGLDCIWNWNMDPDLELDKPGSHVDGGSNRVWSGTLDCPKVAGRH